MSIVAVMGAPLPELTDLILSSNGTEIDRTEPVVLSNWFLGGSAPRLRFLQLTHFPYPISAASRVKDK